MKAEAVPWEFVPKVAPTLNASGAELELRKEMIKAMPEEDEHKLTDLLKSSLGRNDSCDT